MKEFFKFTLASALGTFFAGAILLFIVFVVLIGSLLASAGEEKEYHVSDGSILHLAMNVEIDERARDDDFTFPLPGGFEQPASVGLDKILRNIEKAAKDDRIKGIFLDMSMLHGGWATTKEIRDALVEFRKTGKFIVSYAEFMDQKSYYLASVSNKVYLYPEGAMEIAGLSANVAFYKNALDKLGVEMQVIRGSNNKFKSAVEPFLGDRMSEENREQTRTYLTSMWNEVLTSIATSRKTSVDSLTVWADQLAIEFPDDAVKHGLVDKLLHRDEVMTELARLAGKEEPDDLKLVSLKNYDHAPAKARDGDGEDEGGRDRIAVIYCNGAIESGKNDDDVMGSATTAEAIKKARENKNVKAVVLRVNSPGGSALASDVIWHEVKKTTQVKPVVVSMGDVAASGGYYISAAATKIYAQPNTITGSIGVFGVLPNAKKLANDFGVTFDGVKTNEHADLGTPWRGLTEEEYRIIQKGVDKVYDKFLTVVAEGRKLPKSTVDSIGQGRVWSGTDAKRIGLVDEIGGIDEAVREAARLAKITDYSIMALPELKSRLEEIMAEFTGKEVKQEFIRKELGSNYEIYRQYKYLLQVSEMKGVQMRMPVLITVE